MSDATLPNSWRHAKLEELLLSYESGGRPKGGVRKITEGIPSIGGEHVSWNGGFDFTNIKYVPETFYSTLTKGKIQTGDVLIVKDGATTGKTGFVSKNFPFKKAAINEHVFLVRTKETGFNSKFIFYWLTSSDGQKVVRENFQGTAQGGITSAFFKNAVLPVAPLPEQRRIVEKLEELFTRIDAGTRELESARIQLKRYRQAVLKSAFAGKLTEGWRKKNAGKAASAKLLLEEVKKENKGKSLPELDTSELPELPSTWCWARIRDIVEDQQYGTSDKAVADPAGVPVLRMGNIQGGKLIFDTLKYMPKNWKDKAEYLLSDGDVLFNRTNSAELVGKTAMYSRNQPEAVFASYLIRLKIRKDSYLPSLVSLYINSANGRNYIASVVSQQVGQANVNGTKLGAMHIPMIPIAEQRAIAEEIDRMFSIADEAEQAIDLSLKKAQALRQSILKKAFEGRLVPQDPKDEPASVLLERIHKERAEQSGQIKRRKRA